MTTGDARVFIEEIMYSVYTMYMEKWANMTTPKGLIAQRSNKSCRLMNKKFIK